MTNRATKGAREINLLQLSHLTEDEARAHDDPYQFQWWALGLVGARPTEHDKGADKGIDGRLYLQDAKLFAICFM